MYDLRSRWRARFRRIFFFFWSAFKSANQKTLENFSGIFRVPNIFIRESGIYTGNFEESVSPSRIVSQVLSHILNCFYLARVVDQAPSSRTLPVDIYPTVRLGLVF